MIMIRGIGLENTHTPTDVRICIKATMYMCIYMYIFAMVIGYVKLQHTPKHHKPCPRTGLPPEMMRVSEKSHCSTRTEGGLIRPQT